MRVGKVRRQPGEQQVENIVVRTVPKRQTAYFRLLQQIEERRSSRPARRIFRLRPAVLNVLAFSLRESAILARILVISAKQRQIQQTDNPRRRKIPTPAKMEKDQSKNRHTDGRREFRHGIKHGRRQASFIFWEPIANRFRGPGKRWRLSDAQKKTRSKQTRDSSRNCRKKRSQAPDRGADDSHSPHTEPVQQ